jgi:hypothetical protein
VTFALSGPLLFTVPFVTAVVTALVWANWSKPADPPRLRGYAVRQGWQVDPIALLDRELLEGRLADGILAVHDRLLTELIEHHGLKATDVQRQFYLLGKKPPTVVREACAQVRALAATYEVAYRAEDRGRTDLWSRWRRPAWAEAARLRFEEELSAVEALWPQLEAAS